MADLRESILARLVVVAATVPDIATVRRNRVEISETMRPAMIVLDADETVEDDDLGNGRPANSPVAVVMTPEVFILASTSAADIGGELNKFRRRLIRRVLTDATLLGLVGTSGAIRYAGAGTDFAADRAMAGRMAASFAFKYFLKPMDLED